RPAGADHRRRGLSQRQAAGVPSRAARADPEGHRAQGRVARLLARCCSGPGDCELLGAADRGRAAAGDLALALTASRRRAGSRLGLEAAPADHEEALVALAGVAPAAPLAAARIGLALRRRLAALLVARGLRLVGAGRLAAAAHRDERRDDSDTQRE